MSHPTPSNKPAPWKSTFEQHLRKCEWPSVEFTLATVTPKGEPRVRTCIFRGFWASLPENEHNKLPKNPAVYESDCPTFTTDARMEKTYHMFATGKGKGDLEQSRSGTGGGGPVEAVFWCKPTNTQWRIRGKSWVIAANDVEGGTEAAQNSGTFTVKAELQRYMRQREGSDDNEKPEWAWRRELENYFENLSPMMRGSFKNPPPGQPLAQGKDDKAGEDLGQKAGHLADEELARKNFRVAVITPLQVEAVDLTDPAKATRKIWTLDEEHGGPGGTEPSESIGEWNVVETWP
jgi:pyridoxamine 5'-phosphate oxidase